MDLLIKALAGATVVVVIQLVSRTNSYYVAGLVPLFPTFALISHYIVGTQRTTSDLKETILFGMFSMIPYLAYLVGLYFLVDRYKLATAMLGAIVFWAIAALALVVIWGRASAL